MPPNIPDIPETPEAYGLEGVGLQDLVASAFFGMPLSSLSKTPDRDLQARYRDTFDTVIGILENPEKILKNIQTNTLTVDQIEVLTKMVESGGGTYVKGFIEEFVVVNASSYTDVSENNPGVAEAIASGGDFAFLEGLEMGVKRAGYNLYYMFSEFVKWKQVHDSIQQQVDPYDYIKQQLDVIGGTDDDGNPLFEINTSYLDTNKAIRDVLLRNMGKFREDTPPADIAVWQCRIGASTFFIPPTNINVSQVFKTGSFTGAAIRQPNTPKFNSGHSETTIEMNLYFPNHETIWGFLGDEAVFNWDPQTNPKTPSDPNSSFELTDDATIDYFLSSLRGLVTQFKYAPFLPVKNQYLNQAHDVQAVTMLGMTVSTLPDFPFCLVVNLQMAKFNHKAYLPMVQDFDQAIHWGKFRQFMGKAASRMSAIVNQGFLTEYKTDQQLAAEQAAAEETWMHQGRPSNFDWPDQEIIEVYEGDLIPRFDKVADIRDGRFFDLYVPKTTPAKLFVPDTTDFRQPGEDNVVTSEKWNGILGFLGIDAVDKPYFDFFEYDTAYRDGRLRNERYILRNWLEINNIAWNQMGSSELNKFVETQVEHAVKSGALNENNTSSYANQLRFAWFTEIYGAFRDDPVFRKAIENRIYEDGQYILNEWKIPMEKISIDWNSCIIQGISVSLSNNIARLQVQMQDEPVHQHIGGGDSMVNVSMIVIGESNLIRLRRTFDHINGLARLEHGHGVLGFLGIKNVVTALCGIKYVLPLSFEVDTIPNFPRAYQVRLSLIDFDIFQQKREQLSSAQQKDLVEAFGKRNPFLRIKQRWGAFNAYPDLPLDVRDEEGNIVGHFDPDWYFRSFVRNDKDIHEWDTDVDHSSIITAYENLKSKLNEADTGTVDVLRPIFDQLEKKVRDILSSGVDVIEGYEIDAEGNITKVEKDPREARDTALRYFLGTLDDSQEKLYYIEQSRAGSIALGHQDIRTGADTDGPDVPPHTFTEDIASRNSTTSSVEGTVPLSEYQHEYWDKTDNPTRQFELMAKDWDYRQLDGRMIRAFPTYMLWLIDEGGRFAGIKLFDNFYGLNSVIDFSVVQSEDSMDDTLVLRVSNLFQRLNTPYKDSIISENDSIYETPIGRVISTSENRNRNLLSGLTDELVEINSIRLKPGVRVHLRAGYGSNPNSLQTIFNGVITEVEQGDIMTVIAQSDAVELSAMVNSTNKKGHSGTLDGGMNTGFWLSEPRDLMVRLLSMGSSAFKEWVAWGTKGTIFSENRFGIRHFGSILYETMTSNEDIANKKKYAAVSEAITMSNAGKGANQDEFATSLGNLSQQVAGLDFGGFSAIYNGNMIAIMQAMWVNSFKKRDYEIFKRNIYPGNGLGIAQYMAGDAIDAGVILSTVTSTINKEKIVDSDKDNSTADEPTVDAAQVAETNKKIVDSAKNGMGFSKEDDTEVADYINRNDFVSPDVEGIGSFDGGSPLDSLFSGVGYAAALLETVADTWKYTNPSWWMGKAVGWIGDQIPGVPGALIGFVGDTVAGISNPLALAKGVLTLPGRIAGSPIGRLMGMWSANDDDDMYGYDEVSFRAQTYMKSVWDMFRLCAALLPNYIVAVRPFEERSTIFYGKPHWLYTSGVVPVSNGVGKNSKPNIEGADQELEALVRVASQNLSSFDSLQRQLNDISALDKSVRQNPEATYAAAIPGVITPEALQALPDEWPNGAFLFATEGLASLEMHLPAVPTFDGDLEVHRQLPDLPAELRWPMYMDRVGGGIGGEKGYHPSEEDQSLPGQPGAFHPLSPESEQWYISAPWPYMGDAPDNFVKRGFPEIAKKIVDRGVRNKDYRDKRILVYSVETQKAVVCTPGDWGPHPGVMNSDGSKMYICGLAPDVHHTLGTANGAPVILRVMPDSTQLGPYRFDTGLDVTVMGNRIPNPTGSDELPSAVDPETGESFSIDLDPMDNPFLAWRNATASLISRRIIELGQLPASDSVSDEIEAQNRAGNLLNSDPIVFAYHFGWKYPTVPVYIDVTSGVGVDVAGLNAKKIYDENADPDIDAPDGGRNSAWAMDIWEDFRKDYKSRTTTVDIYNKVFPTDEGAEKFDQIYDMFLRFMWQVPSNRAWLVSNVDRERDSLITQGVDIGTLGAWDDGGLQWEWDKVDPVWRTFITSRDITIDQSGTPFSPATRQYMASHNEGGSNAENVVTGTLEDVKNWFDENIGEFIGMIGDTISGFLSMLRLSMMQIGVGLNLAGTMQKQSNILNSIFNDSIYYQEGTEGSLLRLIDNPFTREYGEPVVEIREPFQRVHFLSSFQHILSNNISENLNGVATVVTASSDGKYPVTVHFDKGVSPERQVEKAVETGLFWDNAVGSGLTGMFQPLLHPIEALRSVSKTATGSSDLLSSKRVALWHLKESLKDIYTGELIVLGNPDIRAGDLVYIADVYERMYGMVEVEKVIHHFTAENGFVSSITPNAIVTINDPARWSLIAWMWRKFAEHNVRNDTRAMMAIKADRDNAIASQNGLSSEDIPNVYSTQLLGMLQYTQGNTALVRDVSALFSTANMSPLSAADQATNKIAAIDQKLLLAKSGLTAAGVVGGVAAGFLGSPVLAAGVVTGTYVLGDLLWDAWGWVKDNLLDQHGCYIQYLNKDGQPMDAGLSYYQGIAVGQHHSLTLFPKLLGISGDVTIRDGEYYRITTNDLLSALGWSEVETSYIQQQTSWFVNQINSEVLKVSGRSPEPLYQDKYIVVIAEVLDPAENSIADGDTFNVKIIEDINGNFLGNSEERVRLKGVNTSELVNYGDDVNLNQLNDLGYMAQQYLVAKFTPERNRRIAIRIDPEERRDAYGRLLGVVFHNVPPGTPANVTKDKRGDILAGLAKLDPILSWDSYLEDGRPYTLNWELVMTGFGNVDMRESLWNTPGRLEQLSDIDTE